MLDNASYHSSKNTKERLVNLEFNTKFLPPYYPNLAPVEQFFKLLKSKIRIIDLKTKGNMVQRGNWIPML